MIKNALLNWHAWTLLALICVLLGGCRSESAQSALKSGNLVALKRIFKSANDTDTRILVSLDMQYWQLPLHLAVQEGQVDAVRYLLAIGASPNAQNAWGETPFHLLSDGADYGVIRTCAELLCRHGGDINLLPESGNTALQCAIIAQNIEAVTVILELGGDPNLPDERGNNALFYAREYFNTKENSSSILRAKSEDILGLIENW